MQPVSDGQARLGQGTLLLIPSYRSLPWVFKAKRARGSYVLQRLANFAHLTQGTIRRNCRKRTVCERT